MPCHAAVRTYCCGWCLYGYATPRRLLQRVYHCQSVVMVRHVLLHPHARHASVFVQIELVARQVNVSTVERCFGAHTTDLRSLDYGFAAQGGSMLLKLLFRMNVCGCPSSLALKHKGSLLLQLGVCLSPLRAHRHRSEQ